MDATVDGFRNPPSVDVIIAAYGGGPAMFWKTTCTHGSISGQLAARTTCQSPGHSAQHPLTTQVKMSLPARDHIVDPLEFMLRLHIAGADLP